jgi:hypothetical protein
MMERGESQKKKKEGGAQISAGNAKRRDTDNKKSLVPKAYI